MLQRVLLRLAVTGGAMNKGLLREKKTIKAMIEIYCRGNDHVCREHESCESCLDLLRYAHDVSINVLLAKASLFVPSAPFIVISLPSGSKLPV